MKNLKMLYDECYEMVVNCGITPVPIKSVTVNSRATSRWGACKYHWEYDNKNQKYVICCAIEISKSILGDDSDLNAVKSTIIHEILHAANPGEHHGGNWKKDARKIMNRYPEIKITRTSSSEEFGIAQPKTKYAVVCEKCGYELGRNRMCKLIRYPNEFVHGGGCGGALKRIR